MIAVIINQKTRQQYCTKTRTLECWNWCIEQFGLPVTRDINWKWDSYLTFYFANEADATAFVLRWS